MKKETKIGIALSAAMVAASGCATNKEATNENEALNSEPEIRSVSVVATKVATGQTRTIAAQPVNGLDGCKNFANTIASAGFDVEAECISGEDGTGIVVDNYQVEYEEPSTTEEQTPPAP